jgi:ABC-type cobalamin/Fe3+-siderophores transport system ATPase subunit
MKLEAFRIQNFRSVIDSGWISLSPDGVTVLVGQNESGKTSVLQALHCVLSRAPITPDDKRIDADDPVVFLRGTVDWGETEGYMEEHDQTELLGFKGFVKKSNGLVDLKCEWRAKTGKTELTEFHCSIANSKDFETHMEAYRNAHSSASKTTMEIVDTSGEANQASSSTTELLDSYTAAEALYELLPLSILFDADSGLLPNTADIDAKSNPYGLGANAAKNFLTIADIDLPKLVAGDERYRQNILNKANNRVSDDFASFWSQLIGDTKKLSLKCDFRHYDTANSEKVGKAYLEFWICDGNTQLYPKQRSLGVRWFVSFYLQLRATEKTNERRLFLLDEPGANLHAKAQGDVLKLIDKLKSEIPIVYSTHSPEMIEFDRLFRVRAVQRNGEKEDSPTIVMDAHQLGAASSDTLSPVLAAMGSDMSKQTVIKKTRNVLLEEVSGFYYLKSFWKIAAAKEVVHFIAATGVNKLPALANMFLGWGLDFLVAVDDDKQGREVFGQLKKDLFGDDDELARTRLLKIPGCTSIEEAFSKSDFKRLVLRNDDAVYEGGNADFMKASQISKPITAYKFWLDVESGKITKKDFEQQSLTTIENIIQSLADLLKSRPA